MNLIISSRNNLITVLFDAFDIVKEKFILSLDIICLVYIKYLYLFSAYLLFSNAAMYG